MQQSISTLRNLGPKSAAWLQEAGIATLDDLRHLGPVVAFRRVKDRQPRASANLLWALAAGLQNRNWRELTRAEKYDLRRQLKALDDV